jgi:hypothetical protein
LVPCFGEEPEPDESEDFEEPEPESDESEDFEEPEPEPDESEDPELPASDEAATFFSDFFDEARLSVL